MARLTAKGRKRLKKSQFAGPDRSYPDEDPSHARDALAMVSRYGDAEEKARVRAKVHRDYPSIGKAKDAKGRTGKRKSWSGA